jgi:uncharacterized protein
MEFALWRPYLHQLKIFIMSSAVQPKERIHYLDIIRGFAISGVLFAFVFWNLGNAPASTYTLFDHIIDQAGFFLIDSKCYTLLATLFAVGFVLHMNKPDNKAKNLYTYRRRLLGLLIIGALHALLLRNGDILAPYAITAFLITFLYGSSRTTLIVVMIIIFLIDTLLPQTWLALGLSFPQRPTPVSNYLVENFAWVKYWYSTAIFFWGTTLFLLVGGILIGRTFIQDKRKLTTRQIQIIAITAFVCGTLSYLTLKFYAARIGELPDIGNSRVLRAMVYRSLDMIHKLGMASTYACVFYLLSRNFRLSALANLGRMSLTNYVVQAAIVVPICLIFNLFDHITPTIALIMTVVIWVFQIQFSKWWLKQHQFGPLEWVLRTITYGRSLSVAKQGNKQQRTPTSVKVQTELQ